MKIPNRRSGMLMDNLIPSFCQFIEIDYLRCLILQLACEWRAWTNCWSLSDWWIEHILLQYVRACSWGTRMFRGGQNRWTHWCKLSGFEYTICSQVFPFLVSTSSTVWWSLMFLTSMTWLNFCANELKAECILERVLSDFEHGRCHQKHVWAKISFGGVWPVCNPTGSLVLVRVTLVLGHDLRFLNFDPLMQEWLFFFCQSIILIIITGCLHIGVFISNKT